jgi:hypothetical protein
MPVVPAERRQPAVLTQTHVFRQRTAMEPLHNPPFAGKAQQHHKEGAGIEVHPIFCCQLVEPFLQGLPGPLLRHVHSLIPPVLL